MKYFTVLATYVSDYINNQSTMPKSSTAKLDIGIQMTDHIAKIQQFIFFYYELHRGNSCTERNVYRQRIQRKTKYSFTQYDIRLLD